MLFYNLLEPFSRVEIASSIAYACRRCDGEIVTTDTSIQLFVDKWYAV